MGKIDGTVPGNLDEQSDIQVDSATVNGDLTVNGTTTTVDDIVLTDIDVQDGSGTTQFRFDGDATTPYSNINGNDLRGVSAVEDQSNNTHLTLNDGGSTQFSRNVNIQGNWIVDSQSEDSVERLRIQGAGADDPAELFLQAKGTSDVARVTVTPDSSTSDFSSLTLESDGTNQIISSSGVGSASTLPMQLQIDGTSLLQLTTSNTVQFDAITGTPTMSGHDHTSSGMTAIPNSGLANDSVTFSAGTALGNSGDGTVALGGSETINVTGPLTSIDLKTSGDVLQFQADGNNDLVLQNTTDSITLVTVDQDNGTVDLNSSGSLQIGGTQVVTSQQSSIADLGTSNLSNTTTDDALEAIGDTTSSDQSAAIERNFAEVQEDLSAIKTALRNHGLINT